MLSSSGMGMEDAVGYGTPDLRLRPRRIAVAETRRHQFPHGTVHPASLLQALLRGHGPINRHLPLMGSAHMVRFSDGGHEADDSGVGLAGKSRPRGFRDETPLITPP